MASDSGSNVEIGSKLNVLIALAIKQLTDDGSFASDGKRKQGAGDLVRYLSDLGLDAKDIAQIIGSPIGQRANAADAET